MEAAYARDKSRALARANLQLQVVRHLWRLCYELKVIPLRRYAHGAELLESVGPHKGAPSAAIRFREKHSRRDALRGWSSLGCKPARRCLCK